MKSICVFCASSNAIDPLFLKLAAETGRLIAAKGWRVVYGGARGGMMGALANAALEAGGQVTGVIPEVLGPQERAHQGLTALHIVSDMHERQQKMMGLADGFVVLPGGLGTLAELFEILTWKAIGLHGKKIALIDAGGYWEPLLEQIRQSEEKGFLHAGQAQLFKVFEGIEDIGDFFTD